MQCSFDETINYPDGSFRSSTCINRAEILIVNDPCYGLRFACAYNRLKKMIFSYHTQYTAAMKATSLGLCKRIIKHALEDEQDLKGGG